MDPLDPRFSLLDSACSSAQIRRENKVLSYCGAEMDPASVHLFGTLRRIKLFLSSTNIPLGNLSSKRKHCTIHEEVCQLRQESRCARQC